MYTFLCAQILSHTSHALYASLHTTVYPVYRDVGAYACCAAVVDVCTNVRCTDRVHRFSPREHMLQHTTQRMYHPTRMCIPAGACTHTAYRVCTDLCHAHVCTFSTQRMLHVYILLPPSMHHVLQDGTRGYHVCDSTHSCAQNPTHRFSCAQIPAT